MVTFPASPSAVEARQQLFLDLYQGAFPAVAQLVSRRGGTLEEAQDIFQEALVLYYERKVVGAPDTLTEPHPTAYLLGIARHLWIKQYHRRSSEVPLERTEAFAWVEAPSVSPSRRKVLRFLSVAGQKCMELLRAFYYEQLPLAEVADTFGYSGVRSATVQKYKCLEKVRHTVKEKSISYEDFLEDDPATGGL